MSADTSESSPKDGTMSVPVSWAEGTGELDDLLAQTKAVERIESEVDANGMKTVTEYTYNDEGQRVKTVKRVRVRKVTKLVPKGVVERRTKICKFVNQFSKSSGPDSLVTSRGEELKLDLSTRSRIEETGERMPDFAEKMRERLIQGGRRTNTSTWEDLVKQSESVLEGSRGPDGGDAMRDGDAFGVNRSDSSGLPQAPGVEANTRDGTYVPPSLRRSMGIRGLEDGYKVRVTNLSPSVTREELYSIFSKVGFVKRCIIVHDRETNISRGFGFVVFESKTDAEVAIKRYTGFGLDNLLLSVEWAKS